MFWVPPEFKIAPAYTKAAEWAADFTPKPDYDYKPALDFARQEYDRAHKVFDALDDKADSLIKTSGTLATILVAAAAAFDLAPTLMFFLPFALFCVGFGLAMVARKPMTFAEPVSISDLLDDIGDQDLQPSQVDGLLAAAFYCAEIGTSVMTNWKATRLEQATGCIFLGVISLVLPLFSA